MITICIFVVFFSFISHTAAQAYEYEHIPVTPTGVSLIGGGGGSYFEYHSNGGYPVKLVKVWTDGDNTIRSIYFTTTDSTSYQIGSVPTGIESKDFTFNDDEALTELILTGNGIGTRLGSITWKTSAGRAFSVGNRQTDYTFNTKNSILMGFWGNHGIDIDALGVYLMKPIKESKLVVLDYPEWNDAAVNDESNMFYSQFDYTNFLNTTGNYDYKYQKSYSTNKQWTVTNGKETDKSISVSATVPFVDVGVEASFTAKETEENTYQNEDFQLQLIEATHSVPIPACTRVTGYVRGYVNNNGMPYNGVRQLTFQDDTTLNQPIEGIYYSSIHSELNATQDFHPVDCGGGRSLNTGTTEFLQSQSDHSFLRSSKTKKETMDGKP
jgi:Jacalin-like lectin domain